MRFHQNWISLFLPGWPALDKFVPPRVKASFLTYQQTTYNWPIMTLLFNLCWTGKSSWWAHSQWNHSKLRSCISCITNNNKRSLLLWIVGLFHFPFAEAALNSQTHLSLLPWLNLSRITQTNTSLKPSTATWLTFIVWT